VCGLPSESSIVQVAHTADLDQGTLFAARALLDEVFGAEMTDHDWEHALGGVHALVWEGPRLAGHAALVQRRILYGARALRTGYVEGVAVRADRRRRGYGAAMMEALERVIRSAYELGALGASEDGAGFYGARGWKRWRGETWALTPDGAVATAEEDGHIYVYEVSARLNLSSELMCDWREGDLW
jgi:aminoglycoside 2'-N-acetyltransferase I